jgi:hypothetical protein
LRARRTETLLHSTKPAPAPAPYSRRSYGGELRRVQSDQELWMPPSQADLPCAWSEQKLEAAAQAAG